MPFRGGTSSRWRSDVSKFLDEAVPPSGDNALSQAAAESVRASRAFLLERTLTCVKDAGSQGRTCEEIERLTGMKHQTASARVPSMWQAEGKRDENTQLSMVPEEILAGFDVASTFATSDSEGRLYLAHWIEESEEQGVDRYLVAQTSRRRIDALKAGTLALLEALDQPWVWLVDITRDEARSVSTPLLVSFEEIPSDCLPVRDTFLASVTSSGRAATVWISND